MALVASGCHDLQCSHHRAVMPQQHLWAMWLICQSRIGFARNDIQDLEPVASQDTRYFAMRMKALVCSRVESVCTKGAQKLPVLGLGSLPSFDTSRGTKVSYKVIPRSL